MSYRGKVIGKEIGSCSEPGEKGCAARQRGKGGKPFPLESAFQESIAGESEMQAVPCAGQCNSNRRITSSCFSVCLLPSPSGEPGTYADASVCRTLR